MVAPPRPLSFCAPIAASLIGVLGIVLPLDCVYAQDAQELIVAIGDFAPGSGGGTFSSFREHSELNNHGQFVFVADLDNGTSPTGLFRASVRGGTSVPIMFMGDPVPGFPGATFRSPMSPQINDRGDVAWIAAFFGTVVGNAHGIFGRFDEGPVVPIATSRDLAPGTTGQYSEISPTISMNNSGEIAFRASYFYDFVVDEGIFVASQSASRAILLEGQPAPPGSNAIYTGFRHPGINDRGDIAVAARFDTEPVYTSAMLLHSDGSTVALARRMDSVPRGGGAVFWALGTPFGTPEIANDGSVVFVAVEAEIEPEFPFQVFTETVLYESTGGVNSEILRPGDVMPGTGGGVLGGGLGTTGVRANELGEAAYQAYVDGGTTPHGVFVSSVAAHQAIVLVGDPEPNGGGGVFSFAGGQPGINDHGEVLFRGTINGGTGTIGIYAVPEPGILIGLMIAVSTLTHRAAARGRNIRDRDHE